MANILLIDDWPGILERFRKALEDAEHSVTALQYTKGVEDVIVAANPVFDIIVCDNNVEHIDDGIELAKRLRDQGYAKPFILHTGGELRHLKPRLDFDKYRVQYCMKAEYESLLVETVDEVLTKAT